MASELQDEERQPVVTAVRYEEPTDWLSSGIVLVALVAILLGRYVTNLVQAGA